MEVHVVQAGLNSRSSYLPLPNAGIKDIHHIILSQETLSKSAFYPGKSEILSGERLRETQRAIEKPQEAERREAGRTEMDAEEMEETRAERGAAPRGSRVFHSAFYHGNKMSQAGNLYKTDFQVYLAHRSGGQIPESTAWPLEQHTLTVLYQSRL